MAASVTLPHLVIAPALNAYLAHKQAVFRGLITGLGYQIDVKSLDTKVADIAAESDDMTDTTRTEVSNPVDNIRGISNSVLNKAGVRYVINWYGWVRNVPGVKAVRSGHAYVGH